MLFSKELISWYQRNKRDLPWRNTSNPYYIWISEVILQQTRVNQGISYYHKFIEAFPDVFSLAIAHEDKILKVWQGLGYYSRARNLHAAAKQIVNEWDGKFPNTYDQLIKLKGVGGYTAAAIASIAFNKVHAVLDGNVFRVLARLYNVNEPINSRKGIQEFTFLANQSMPKKNPGIYNQAMMELGAIICTPRNPDCTSCCVQNYCLAYKSNTQAALPVKLNKLKIRKRFFYYFLVMYKNKTFIHKRLEKDIWKGLYELPLVELDKPIEIEEVLSQLPNRLHVGINSYIVKSVSPSFVHKLSHQTIYAHFVTIELKQLNQFLRQNYKIILKKELAAYAFPVLVSNYLNSCDFRDI